MHGLPYYDMKALEGDIGDILDLLPDEESPTMASRDEGQQAKGLRLN